VIRGPQLPVRRPQSRARPILVVVMTAGLTFAVLTFGVGPSLAVELTGLLIGWCAAVASLERLVLRAVRASRR
jgi:hypothetical protein